MNIRTEYISNLISNLVSKKLTQTNIQINLYPKNDTNEYPNKYLDQKYSNIRIFEYICHTLNQMIPNNMIPNQMIPNKMIPNQIISNKMISNEMIPNQTKQYQAKMPTPPLDSFLTTSSQVAPLSRPHQKNAKLKDTKLNQTKRYQSKPN